MDRGRSLKSSQRGGHATTSGASNSQVELRDRISSLEQDLAATKHKFQQLQESTLSALRTLAQQQKLGFGITSVEQQTQAAFVEEDEEEEKDQEEEEGQKSRPRRITRTRTGCTNCRLRRKKCGEERPTCDACRRLGIECNYPAKYQLPKSAERRLGADESPERERVASHGEDSHAATACAQEDQFTYPFDAAAYSKALVDLQIEQAWHIRPDLFTLPIGKIHPHLSQAIFNNRFPQNDTTQDRDLSLVPTKHLSCANDATQAGLPSQPLNGETYGCSKCDYEARSKYHLKRHQTKHTDEKPFNCRKCGKGYKWKDSLDSHQKTCS